MGSDTPTDLLVAVEPSRHRATSRHSRGAASRHSGGAASRHSGGAASRHSRRAARPRPDRRPGVLLGALLAGGVSDGLDALLAIVQMPKGVPVATVGVGNGENAALLAAAILAVGDPGLGARLAARRATQAEAIAADPANEGL